MFHRFTISEVYWFVAKQHLGIAVSHVWSANDYVLENFVHKNIYLEHRGNINMNVGE